MADPGMAAIIARAKETEPGLVTGSRGRQTNAAARQLAERAIRARLARSGASPEDVQSAITSILGAAGGSQYGLGTSSLAGLIPPMASAPFKLGGAAMSAAGQ